MVKLKYLEDALMCIWVKKNDDKDVHVDFKILDYTETTYEDGVQNIEYGLGECGEYTTSIDAATPVIEGYIKWDGCANYHYPQNKDAMRHACGMDSFISEVRAMKVAYMLAGELLPGNEATLG